jgi:hypothetical protein
LPSLAIREVTDVRLDSRNIRINEDCVFFSMNLF